MRSAPKRLYVLLSNGNNVEYSHQSKAHVVRMSSQVFKYTNIKKYALVPEKKRKKTK